MSELATDGVVVVIVGVLIHVMWTDFTLLKIRNRSILVLVGLYLLFAALQGFDEVRTDVAAGALLFLISLVFWAMRAMGAGDVKLYGVLGLLIGLRLLPLFVVLLLAASFVFLGLVSIAGRSRSEGWIISRLRETKASGKAPYGVIMCAAAIPVIVLRTLW